VVQGVGFRPYVYRLAREHRLEGSVTNTGEGVVIRVRGEAASLSAFVADLPRRSPPLARITELVVEDGDVACAGGFLITESETGRTANTLIPPDVTVCQKCLSELFDPADRRYRYPFINCTDCGPRYTLIRGLPYDRSLTTMASFPLCADCRREYEDPDNRRFHAEPNACPRCGPRCRLLDAAGREAFVSDPIRECLRLLEEGRIVAVKGLGGFHLVVDATSEPAVLRLRERKHREEKPFALMAASVSRVREFCRMSRREEALLESPEHPIVLLERAAGSRIAPSVAPHQSTYGVMLPHTPLQALVLDSSLYAVVATSGNRSEEPIVLDDQEAVERLSGITDFFLVHDREIHRRADDSIARVAFGRTRLLRRARGYAPRPLLLKEEVPSILAVGGQLKNTVCLTRGREAFLSPHGGDLDNIRAFEAFRDSIRHLSKTLEITPVLVAHDLHPEYLSTRWALEESDLPALGVQHHHAHIASVLAEQGLDETVVGIALDGMGFSEDGTVWGGEILVASLRSFERKWHLPQVLLPGGDRAAREPWRMAIAWLHRLYGRELFDLGLPFLEAVPRDRVRRLVAVLDSGFGWPLTSSCGRLFDAVSALTGLRLNASFEGQAAMELEAAAKESGDPIAPPDGSLPVDEVFRGVVEAIQQGRDVPSIAARFHAGLADALADAAIVVGRECGLSRVALGGGSFQNTILLSRIGARLEARGFDPLTPGEVPANDGGLALGQAAVAAATIR
jgi:hydrogenase maturation protein HypF